eukprot:scaffold328110_cov64-Tisochrysis_lutea.AAC.1
MEANVRVVLGVEAQALIVIGMAVVLAATFVCVCVWGRGGGLKNAILRNRVITPTHSLSEHRCPCSSAPPRRGIISAACLRPSSSTWLRGGGCAIC